MQTYLPYGNLGLSAVTLSDVDLSQQIRSGLAILAILRSKDGGRSALWHPTIAMWKDHETLLALFVYASWQEWRQQGFRDTFDALDRIADMGLSVRVKMENVETPWWFGDNKYHAAQRSALLRHDPEWYKTTILTKGAKPLRRELWPTNTPGEYIVGPEPPWDGSTGMTIHGRPMFPELGKLKDSQFLEHVNNYHNLLGNKSPLTMRDKSVFEMARALHDRFHSLKVYNTHDHIR